MEIDVPLEVNIGIVAILRRRSGKLSKLVGCGCDVMATNSKKP